MNDRRCFLLSYIFGDVYLTAVVDISPQTWVLSGLMLYGSKTQIHFQVTVVLRWGSDKKKCREFYFFFLLLTQKMWKNHCVKVVCYQEYLFFSSPHLKTTVTYFHCCWISIFHLGLLLWKKIKAFCVLSFLVDHQHFWIQLSTFYWTKLGPIQLSTMSRYQIKVPRKLWAPPAIIMPSSYILRSSFIPQSTLVNIGFSKTMTAEKGPNHCRDAHKMI